MCNIESTLRSGLRPQLNLMASSDKDRSSSLWDLGTLFFATILEAKDFTGQLEATFCDELWPAFRAEIENSRRRITELEKQVDVSNKGREESQKLKSQSEDERTRLCAENRSLRMELEQVLKKGTGVDTEKQILQSKLQSLMEENLNLEKQRQSFVDQVEQLQFALNIAITKELFLMAENKKLAKTRSHWEKSEVHHNRLSLKSQKKLLKAESPSPSTAGKEVEPAEGLQNLKENPSVPAAFSLQDVEQCVDCPVSKLEMMEPMRETSPLQRERSEGPVVAVSESLPSAEAMCQGESAKDWQAMDAQDIICSQRPKTKCDGESRPCPSAGFVDSDETVMDVVRNDPTSAGIVHEYPLVSISSETEAEPCGEPLQLPSGRAFDVISRGAVEKKKMDDTAAVRTAGPLVSISPNLLNVRPLSRTKVGNNPVKGPREQAWRQTRHRTEPSDVDPHDSFLDTPREKVLAQIEEARIAQSLAVPQGSWYPVTDKLECGSIEAREGDKGAQRQNHPSASSRLVVEASNAGLPDNRETRAFASKAPPFKFNEPVRKKRDREALQGIDCQQCKRFYEAVATGDATGMLAAKCEHQNAVSRHRYRYLPPPTPEGFWNIGFDDSVNSPDDAG